MQEEPGYRRSQNCTMRTRDETGLEAGRLLSSERWLGIHRFGWMPETSVGLRWKMLRIRREAKTQFSRTLLLQHVVLRLRRTDFPKHLHLHFRRCGPLSFLGAILFPDSKF